MPTPIRPKRITVHISGLSAPGKYGVIRNANATPNKTLSQNVRHGRQLKGLNFNGSGKTSVNNQPNTKASNELTTISAATPIKKIIVFIL